MNKFYRLFRYELPLHFILLLTNWLPDNVIFLRLRGKLASPFFKSCGKNFRIGRSIVFYAPYNLQFGDNVFIAYGNWFSGSTDIKVGDEVMFGPKSIIISGNHGRHNGSYRYGYNSFKPITIGFGSWIGGNCAILAGACIGKGCVVAANTVVKGVIPDNSLIAGNPGIVRKTFYD